MKKLRRRLVTSGIVAASLLGPSVCSGVFPLWNGYFSSQNFGGANSVNFPAVGDNANSLYYYDPNLSRIRRRNRSNNTDVELGRLSGVGVFLNSMYYQSSNTNLYIAGEFTGAGNVSAVNVAIFHVSTGTWEGGHDLPLDPDLVASAIAVDIRGNIYVGSLAPEANGCDHYDNQVFLKWNAALSRWDSVGGGLEIYGDTQPGVHALAVDNNGTNIYVGGNFATAKNGLTTVSSTNFIKWDAVNGAWVAMGTGLTYPCFDDSDSCSNSFPNCFANAWVNQIAVSPTEVYVAGHFTSGGGIARFTTSGTQLTWGDLLDAEAVSAEGVAYSNGKVYVSGKFDTAGGVTAYGIAQWNASTGVWSALSGGLTTANPPGGRGSGGRLASNANSIIVFEGPYPFYDYAGTLNQQPARWQISSDTK